MINVSSISSSSVFESDNLSNGDKKKDFSLAENKIQNVSQVILQSPSHPNYQSALFRGQNIADKQMGDQRGYGPSKDSSKSNSSNSNSASNGKSDTSGNEAKGPASENNSSGNKTPNNSIVQPQRRKIRLKISLTR